MEEGRDMTRPMVKRAERWPWIWAAITCVLLLALAGTAIAYLHASAAIRCTNDAAGFRSNVGRPDAVLNQVLSTAANPRGAKDLVTDSDANRAVYAELINAQKVRPAPASVRVEFFTVIQHARAVLDANQAFRAQHPLGQCG